MADVTDQDRDYVTRDQYVAELAAIEAKLERAEAERDRLTCALQVEERARDALSDDAGWCDKHRPSVSLRYTSCWRCSREEESAALAKAEAAVARLREALIARGPCHTIPVVNCQTCQALAATEEKP